MNGWIEQGEKLTGKSAAEKLGQTNIIGLEAERH